MWGQSAKKRRFGQELAESTKYARVSTGAVDASSGLGVSVLPEHATYFTAKPLINQEIMTPAPSVSALNQTAYFSFILENKTGGIIDEASLRFTLQFERKDGLPYGPGCNNAIQPVTQWFERIEWIDRGTGEELARYHGDMMNLLMGTETQEDLKALEGLLNLDRKTGRATRRQFASGEIVYIYYTLRHHWFEKCKLDLGALRGDIEIRFYPRGNIFVEDQTALGNKGYKVNLNEIRMIQESAMYGGGQRVDLRSMKLSGAQRTNYLDFQQYVDQGRFWVPGQEYTIDLDQFHNDCAALILLLRKSGIQKDATGAVLIGTDGKEVNINPYVGKQLYKFESLGEQGTIDHENVHGRSLFGDGTPVDEMYFRTRYPTEMFNNDFALCNTVYVVPFSQNLVGMLNGEIDGFHQFRGERERLRIRTGPAPVESVVKYYMINESSSQADPDASGIIPPAKAGYGIIPASRYITGDIDGSQDNKDQLFLYYDGKQVAKGSTRAAVLDDAGNLISSGSNTLTLFELLTQANDTNILEQANLQIGEIRALVKSGAGTVSTVLSSKDVGGCPLAEINKLGSPAYVAGDAYIEQIHLVVTDLDGQPEVQHGANLAKLFELRWIAGDVSNFILGSGEAADAALKQHSRSFISDNEVAEDTYVPGKRGFRAGVYDITLYALYYRQITEANGKITATDVVNNVASG